MDLYSKKRMMAFSIVIAFFVFLDRFLKSLAIEGYFNKPISLIGDILELRFIGNEGIAFSLPLYGPLLNLLIIFVIIGLVYYFLFLIKQKKNIEALFTAGIILGAMSNLVDRLKYGYVIDYLYLQYFTVFNLADVVIVAGALLAVLSMIFKNKNNLS